MKLEPFTFHLASSIINWKRLNVWEGAVRSGKTLASILAFLDFIEHDSHFVYAMSGNTISSLLRNVVTGEFGILNILPNAQLVSGGKSKSTELRIPTTRGIVVCYCYGADNVRSEARIRGLTAYGWYADEVNKQDKGFITQAFARMVQAGGGHSFWTLNPSSPYDPIYSKYIDKWRFSTTEERKAFGGFNWYHCTFEDNPILTAEMIAQIVTGYDPTSFEYKRDVLGLRAVAEGLIYPGALRNKVFQHIDKKDYNVRYCAIDYGACHPNVIGFGGPSLADKNKWAIVKEVYDTTEDRTTSSIVDSYEAICKQEGWEARTMYIAIDPSAEGLSNEFRRRGYHTFLHDAINTVFDGLIYTKRVLYSNNLILSDTCVNAKREMSSYAWDDKAKLMGIEKPIKVNDDACDMIRYFAMTHMKFKVRV